MNDFTDSEYFYHILCNVANTIIDEDNKIMIHDFVDYVRSNIKDYFITCFSSEPDILNQWLMYADNGRGVSIGFKTDSLGVKLQIPFNSYNKIDMKGIFPVEYIPNNQDDVAEVLLKLVANNILNAQSMVSVEKFLLTKKHISFEQEKEIRIVEIQDTNSSANPNTSGLRTPYVGRYFDYRVKNNNQIIPYRKHEFLKENQEFHLNSIWLGPECKTDKKVIELFLNKHKIKIDEGIHYSKSPFIL
jgi:hypothetical protein